MTDQSTWKGTVLNANLHVRTIDGEKYVRLRDLGPMAGRIEAAAHGHG